MPITLGILAQSRQAPAALTDFVLLDQRVIGSPQASVTFSNLGQYASTYRHLQLRTVLRRESGGNEVYLTFNGDSGNNYRRHVLREDGSGGMTAFSTADTSIISNTQTPSSQVAGNFTPAVWDIVDAFNTNKTKVVRILYGSTGDFPIIRFQSGLWNSTASLTTLQLDSFDFAAGSRISLYGVK